MSTFSAESTEGPTTTRVPAGNEPAEPTTMRMERSSLGKTLPLGTRAPRELEPAQSLSGRTLRIDRQAAEALRGPRVDAPARTIASMLAKAPNLARAAVAKPGAAVPFREQALRARYEEPAPVVLPAVGRSRWLALGFITSAVAISLGIACFARIEVTSTAVGALRVQSGPRPIAAQVSGVVKQLVVKAGDGVLEGQVIARIESKEISARVEKAAHLVELLRNELSRADEVSSQLERQSLAGLESKRGLLFRRAALKKRQLAERETYAKGMQQAAAEGASSRIDALGAAEAAMAVREDLLLLQQQVADISIQINDRRHSSGVERLNRELDLRQAEVGLAEAEAIAALGELRAPESGTVESILLAEGQVAQSGSVAARLIPAGDASKVVVFAPAEDSAYLRAGLAANLEFPSLPVSDFGKARATVTRVGNDLASSAEIMEALGTELAPASRFVRVELTPANDETWKKMAPRLGSGARVIGRLETRKRRIITMVFDFLRKWYPE
jgi:multidrug resistance efflux pump